MTVAYQGGCDIVPLGEVPVFSTSDSPLSVTFDYKPKLYKKPQLFNVITGPRGSLKTLLLTKLVCQSLVRCFYLRQFGIVKHVWSNYPVGFKYQSIVDGKWYYLKSEPLNMEALMTFDAGMAEGRVYWDEMDQQYDRQDWAAAQQKLFNGVITQIRKRELSLTGTTQNFNWLNSRAQFQTDWLISCREAAFTGWGRKNRLTTGKMSFLTLKDLSGVSTGYRYDETGKDYKGMLTKGDKIWDCYDTNYEFDPTETKAKYSIKRDAKTIRLGVGGYKVEQTDGGDLHSKSVDPELDFFSHIVEGLKAEGYKKVSPSVIWGRAAALGWEGQTFNGGKALSRLGVARTNKGYILQDDNTPTREGVVSLVSQVNKGGRSKNQLAEVSG